MNKIALQLLVCLPAQSKTLIELGVKHLSCFTHERESVISTEWEVVEYSLETGDNILPAWTYEELCIMIGGSYPKPDLLADAAWIETMDMLQYRVYFPRKCIDFKSGAQAAAEVLIVLIREKAVAAHEASERLEAFVSKKHYNLLTEKLKQKNEKSTRF